MEPSPLQRFATQHELLFKRDSAVGGVGHEYVYSHDRTKRYAYVQTWDASKPLVLWVMLNPGTGDTEVRRRPTLERCKRWSSQWDFGGLLIGNLFATRTKYAKELVKQGEESDPLNEAALRMLRATATETVVAWGSKGRHLDRARTMAPLLSGAACLGRTSSGEPRHPLYVPIGIVRTPWSNHAS